VRRGPGLVRAVARHVVAGCGAALLAAAAVAAPAPAGAQEVEFRGRGDIENDLFLRALIERGAYTLIARDTLLTAADTIHGTALVLRATVRLDGVITGDLVIVDANVFLRPNARILGSVRNIAGGLYPSELAVVQGGVRNQPNAPYLVRREGDGARLVVLGTVRPSVFVRPGLFGFAIPTYDRVDGLTLSYSTGLLLPRVERIEPVLTGRVDYRSQRGAITGGLELELPRGATSLTLGAERTTLTNERWIRDDLDNSVSFLFTAKDLRDYYEADRAYAEVARVLESGERTTDVFVRGQVENSRTLRAGTPWTVLGTPRADNIVVDDGRISSVLAGGSMEWMQPLHRVRVSAVVEAAAHALGGDHAFTRYLLSADWAMAGFANHTLRLQPHFQGPLPGTTSLPRQRWSFVGGSGTLYTFDIAEFRGDRVLFVATQYIIPLDRIRVRFLGSPDLEAMHLVGMAWTADERRDLEQNVGLRLRFPLVNVRVVTDPAAWVDDLKVSVGVNLPRRSWPWERGQ
jgi:hypothetical protein